MSQKYVSKNLTIIVNTCDDYSDVLSIFFKSFEKWWPDCPYPIVINTESKQYSSLYPAITYTYQLNNKKDDWGGRLLSTLSQIKTDFVLMVYDDYILEEKVEIEKIKRAISLLESNDQTAVTYLIKTSLPIIQSDKKSLFDAIKDKVDFKLNSAPGIWRRKVLMNYTSPGDNPWAWEVFGTYRTWGDGMSYYSINQNHKDIFCYNYSKGGAIYRGKWVKDVVEKAKKDFQLNIDWSERGFSSEKIKEPRSFVWKIQFMLTGWKMVGFKALNFLKSYFKKKIS